MDDEALPTGEQEWIELVAVSPDQTPRPLGALTLAALECLPFARDAEIAHDATGHRLPVPHGNLLAYAQHLIAEQHNPDLLFIVQFHYFFGCDQDAPPLLHSPTQAIADEETLRASGKFLDLNDPDVQQAIREGRMVIRT